MKNNHYLKFDFAAIAIFLLFITFNFTTAIGNSEIIGLNKFSIEDSIYNAKSSSDSSNYKPSQTFEKNRTKRTDTRDSIRVDDKDPGEKDTVPHK